MDSPVSSKDSFQPKNLDTVPSYVISKEISTLIRKNSDFMKKYPNSVFGIEQRGAIENIVFGLCQYDMIDFETTCTYLAKAIASPSWVSVEYLIQDSIANDLANYASSKLRDPDFSKASQEIKNALNLVYATFDDSFQSNITKMMADSQNLFKENPTEIGFSNIWAHVSMRFAEKNPLKSVIALTHINKQFPNNPDFIAFQGLAFYALDSQKPGKGYDKKSITLLEESLKKYSFGNSNIGLVYFALSLMTDDSLQGCEYYSKGLFALRDACPKSTPVIEMQSNSSFILANLKNSSEIKWKRKLKDFSKTNKKTVKEWNKQLAAL